MLIYVRFLFEWKISIEIQHLEEASKKCSGKSLIKASKQLSILKKLWIIYKIGYFTKHVFDKYISFALKTPGPTEYSRETSTYVLQ